MVVMSVGHVFAKSGEVFVHFFAIVGIFRIFTAADFLGEAGACYEQHYQKQCANHAPVDDAYACSDGEDIKADPDALLCQIVRMTAHIP